MGWSFNCSPSAKKDFVASLTKGWSSNGVDTKWLTYSCRGNCLWGVVVQSKEGKEVGRFIALSLLARDKGCWGSKDLDESCGPYEVNCPLSYLDLVPTCNSSYSPAWRAKVRAYHEKRSVKPVLGAVYRVGPNNLGIGSMKLTQVGRKLAGEANSGGVYGIKRSQLRERLTEHVAYEQPYCGPVEVGAVHKVRAGTSSMKSATVTVVQVRPLQLKAEDGSVYVHCSQAVLGERVEVAVAV